MQVLGAILMSYGALSQLVHLKPHGVSVSKMHLKPHGLSVQTFNFIPHGVYVCVQNCIYVNVKMHLMPHGRCVCSKLQSNDRVPGSALNAAV